MKQVGPSDVRNPNDKSFVHPVRLGSGRESKYILGSNHKLSHPTRCRRFSHDYIFLASSSSLL